MRYKRVYRPDGCPCGERVEIDSSGNVLSFRTCRICMEIILDSIRGCEYAIAYKKCGDTLKRVLLKQKEFFSLQAVTAPLDYSDGGNYHSGW